MSIIKYTECTNCLCIKCKKMMTCEYHRKCAGGLCLVFRICLCEDFQNKMEGGESNE